MTERRHDDTARSSVQILYVDDERTNRVVFEHGFNKDFCITTCADANEALQILEQREIGVLVSDQRMPGMSGNELLAEVRERWPEIVRIVITAYSDFEPIVQAVNEGLVARYIVKPWDRDELIGLLDWACEVYEVGRRDDAVKARLLKTERLAMIGTIAAGAMHDISQPLVVLLTNSEVLKRLSSGVAPIRDLLRIYGQVLPQHHRQRARELLDELPDLANDFLEAAQMAVQISRHMKSLGRGITDEVAFADPVAIIGHALSISKAELPMGAEARYLGPRPLPAVRIAPTSLFRVLMNVVVNAAQALDRRGERGGRIEVDARIERRSVVITVRDDGPGMSPEVLAKATKEFFSTRSEGTGLGLSQCRRIIEGAGGQLQIDSAEGEGTIVRLTLPRGERVTEPPAQRSAS